MRTSTPNFQSEMAKVDRLAVSANIPNSLAELSLQRGGFLVTKTLTCDGNGAQNDNIFVVTGSVEVLALFGECTEATDATTLDAASFDVYDGTDVAELTDSTGVDLSAITVGSIIGKTAVAANTITYLPNGIAAVLDGAANTSTVFCPFVAVQKTGENTYIRFNFTGDNDTDVDIKFSLRYVPISADGAITAV